MGSRKRGATHHKGRSRSMDARQDQARESKPSEKGPNKAQGKLVWEHRLLWILLIAFLSLWGYHYAMGHVDRQLRIKILRKLNDRFPDHFVQLDHAHLQEGHAILLEGLQVALPTSEGPRDILRIQRIVAHGPLHLLELMRDHVPIEKVQIEGLELSVWPTDAKIVFVKSFPSTYPRVCPTTHYPPAQSAYVQPSGTATGIFLSRVAGIFTA